MSLAKRKESQRRCYYETIFRLLSELLKWDKVLPQFSVSSSTHLHHTENTNNCTPTPDFKVVKVLVYSVHLFSFFPAEYDRHLASPNGMATGYPDPNVNNHGLTQVVKPRCSGGMERPPGTLERVLKVFHYFENSSEPSTWASNIRHGDSTDIKVCVLVELIENQVSL